MVQGISEIQVKKEDIQRGRKKKTKQNKTVDSVAIQNPREEHFKRSGQSYQIIRSKIRVVDDMVYHQITGLNRSFF